MSDFIADYESGGIVVSEIEPEDVISSLPYFERTLTRPQFRALAQWIEDVAPPSRRQNSIWKRDKFVTPSAIYEQMGLAYDALDDDVISNVAEMSESLAFQKIEFESDDKDVQDVWDQIGRDLNLDAWLRAAWRELFTVSQFYGVKYWGQKTYRIRGKGEQRKRRKEVTMWVPIALGFLDPTRVVPVRVDPFGNSRLAWIANESDISRWTNVQEGTQTDELVDSLFTGKYEPTQKEKSDLQKMGVPTNNLMLLNPEMVFRHTLTKSPFERFAKVRMKSLFPLLDIKHQLREMDRAWLLGGVNFILLVRRGTDTKPATRTEVAQTTQEMRAQSSSPVIVSDHRIEIEIITPDIEHVLNADKWNMIDRKIMMNLWGMFESGDGNRDTALTIGRVIARGLASRRHMLRRTLEKELIRSTIDHPFNPSVEKNYPSMEFTPRRIELEFDAEIATLTMELRDRGDLSRETTLAEFGYDQDIEAHRREHEDEAYKDVFKPVNVPFDSPDKTTPGGSGRDANSPGKNQQNNQGGNNSGSK